MACGPLRRPAAVSAERVSSRAARKVLGDFEAGAGIDRTQGAIPPPWQVARRQCPSACRPKAEAVPPRPQPAGASTGACLPLRLNGRQLTFVAWRPHQTRARPLQPRPVQVQVREQGAHQCEPDQESREAKSLALNRLGLPCRPRNRRCCRHRQQQGATAQTPRPAADKQILCADTSSQPVRPCRRTRTGGSEQSGRDEQGCVLRSRG